MVELKLFGYVYTWDWLETYKFLSAFGGFLGCLVMIGLVFAKTTPEKWIPGIGLSVCSLGLIFVVGYFLELIRKEYMEE